MTTHQHTHQPPPPNTPDGHGDVLGVGRVTEHDRPARRSLPVPAEVVAERLEVVAREYEARAAWFRARAAWWRLSGEQVSA